MRNLAYTIVTILCVTIYINGEEISPIPNSVRLLRKSLLPDNQCSESDRNIWKCRDCHSPQYYDGNNDSEYSFDCGSQFPGRPYCNKAAKDISDLCVSDESVCEPDPVRCSSKGIFPSLTNCKAYHLCLSPNASSVPYFCKYNTIYNHVSKSCRLNSPCYTVTDECGTQNKIIPYKLDGSLYVICLGYRQPLLKSCPEGLFFDPATVRCEFKCPGEGAFANPLDFNFYYMCYLIGDVLHKDLVHCPDDATFDDEKKYCSRAGTTSFVDTSNTSYNTTTTTTTMVDYEDVPVK